MYKPLAPIFDSNNNKLEKCLMDLTLTFLFCTLRSPLSHTPYQKFLSLARGDKFTNLKYSYNINSLNFPWKVFSNS